LIIIFLFLTFLKVEQKGNNSNFNILTNVTNGGSLR